MTPTLYVYDSGLSMRDCGALAYDSGCHKRSTVATVQMYARVGSAT